MTIQNADEARALTAKNKWTIEILLAAIEGAASEGDPTVDISPIPNEDLVKELCSRGFTVNVSKGDYDHSCRISW